MKIRKLKINEIGKVSELYFSKMAEHFKEVNEEPITANDFKKILRKNYNKSNMFVLDIEGIKGFIWYVKEERGYNLEEIFSTEKEKGCAKLLIKHLLEDAKKNKIQKINLDVHFKNRVAQNFFRKLGFTERTIEMSLDLKRKKNEN